VPGLLRLRIIAPLDYRVRMAREQLKLAPDQAIAHIHKTDEDRRKWAQFLYGVDWQDASLYDFVINLERVGVEQACDAIAAMVSQPGFGVAPDADTRMSDLTLASRIRATLALDPFTSNLEVDVEARAGSVCVRGSLFEQARDVDRVVRSIPRVASVRLEEPVEATIT
jgi:hypothetical protein